MNTKVKSIVRNHKRNDHASDEKMVSLGKSIRRIDTTDFPRLCDTHALKMYFGVDALQDFSNVCSNRGRSAAAVLNRFVMLASRCPELVDLIVDKFQYDERVHLFKHDS